MSTQVSPCPQCSGLLDADARFCKYCGFDLASSVTELVDAKTPVASGNQKTELKPLFLIAGVVVIGLAGLALLLGAYLYKKRSAQSNVPTASPSSATATISDRARQIEENILNGGKLSENDISGLSPQELRVLRNVHFARYGRKYDKNQDLQDYFNSRPWYKPSDSYNDNLLTDIDKANISLLLTMEKRADSETVSITAQQASVSPTPNQTPATTGGPPDDFIRSSVTNIVKRSLTNNHFGWTTTTVAVASVDVVRRGEFHPNEKFFLVQVRTRGTKTENFTMRGAPDCDNRTIFCSRRCQFDGTNDFRVFRNDYGDWLTDVVAPWQFRLGETCDH